jgi:outer membrane protein OmpA-like peptidoglycan-associated protein
MTIRQMQITFLVVVALCTAVLAGCSSRPAKTPQSDSPRGRPAGELAADAEPAEAVPVAEPAPSAPPAVAAVTPGPSEPSAARTPARVAEFLEHSELRDIYFGPGRFDIGRDSARVLDTVARWLKTNEGSSLLIEGHSDALGTKEANRTLAERRAKAALNYLVKQGVPPNRILIMIYGADRPACVEQTEACMAKNRRVHFLVKSQ